MIPATDADTAGFFEAAADGRLVAYACSDCGQLSFPRQYLCAACRSVEGQWHTIAPRGRVQSWTVVTHQVSAAFEVPYAVVLVEHAEHPHLHFIGRIAGDPVLSMGAELEAIFPDANSGAPLVNWRLSAG